MSFTSSLRAKVQKGISATLPILVPLFAVAVTVSAATTISTNINTGGTLSVTGLSTLLGGATTTTLTLLNGEVISNATDGTIQLGGVSSTTSLTLLNGETLTNATDGTIALTGSFTVSDSTTLGDADGDAFTVRAGSWSLTSTATSTVSMTNGLNFDSNTLVIDPNGDKVGVGSSSPFVALGVTGTTTSSAGAIFGLNGSAISQVRFGTCTYNPGGAISASSTVSTNCTGATGVDTSDRVFVTPVNLENGLVMTSASSTSGAVIQVSVLNTGWVNGGTHGVAITPASRSWFWMAIR
ncbi:MAG: hypothetical protein AAB950_01000 [Patescibacteria group bacterium]